MFEPDNKFNLDKLNRDSPEPDYQNIDANISTESVAFRKRQLESIFVKLIVFGLALGTVLGIGAFYLLKKLGLTKKPYQIQPEKIQPAPEKPASVEETQAIYGEPQSFKM